MKGARTAIFVLNPTGILRFLQTLSTFLLIEKQKWSLKSGFQFSLWSISLAKLGHKFGKKIFAFE